MDLSAYILDVPDYPEPGVMFKDISPLLADHGAFASTVTRLSLAGCDDAGEPVVDLVLGTEARGFILAAPVALELGVGFVPVRKAGKLPREVVGESYALEYGEATLEIHSDAVKPGDRVLLIDDVLATGGTLDATRKLVERCGGVIVGVAVLMELSFLPGRQTLGDLRVTALVTV
ncbi:adenine phosphoribosyltransferase [Nocardioides sp. Kera G14]|nr:adenine phosphoribosyltransferase [Nocardioides sp. Kera G14]